jgi:predicted 3-demethylubiquinone-9 3-methyltransferase (glyoxalase superfamily)
MVTCADQAEIDYYWNSLSAGGEESYCGWLKDKFGVSWQIVAVGWVDMMISPDKEKNKKGYAGTFSNEKTGPTGIGAGINGQ